MAGRRRSDRALRSKLYSPGRPPVAQQVHRRRFWVLIATGQSSEDAALGAGVSAPVGVRWFRKAGGMPPSTLAPSSKPVSGRYLSFAEREEIAIQHAQGGGVRQIARHMGRSGSTISRELRRNAATRGGELDYRASTAQWHAERAARRPKLAKLTVNATLRTYVQDRLAGMVVTSSGAVIPGPMVSWKGRRHGPRKDRRWASAWSPEQIAHRLRHDFPHDETMRISHEAIYQSLYVQGRGALRRELTACLRTGRALRLPRERSRGRGKSFIVPEIMISERPAEAADRAVPGHWEGDLILGLESSAIGTLVERSTRFTMLLHLPRMAEHGLGVRVKNGPPLAGHGAEAVRDSIACTITSLPEQLRRSLTWDQGAEMSQHAWLKIDTGLDVYFCDPHSPWQRGTNENTNGLLRQYFPRGTDLSAHSKNALQAVALTLNTRPRKTLGWKTPAEAFDEYLLSAHMSVATTG
jgi:IS30 family transposase